MTIVSHNSHLSYRIHLSILMIWLSHHIICRLLGLARLELGLTNTWNRRKTHLEPRKLFYAFSYQPIRMRYSFIRNTLLWPRPPTDDLTPKHLYNFPVNITESWKVCQSFRSVWLYLKSPLNEKYIINNNIYWKEPRMGSDTIIELEA